MEKRERTRLLVIAAALYLAVACVARRPTDSQRHGWWEGVGPVIPHDTFPADCSLCHVGRTWQGVRDDFEFDHEAETGVPLEGAHQAARCLRCHNDRGPVAEFAALGCAGCHGDIHFGQLGGDCMECHQETSWEPVGMIERHMRTRFPLTGVHVATACRRCHPGAEVGKFVPTDTECLTCHTDDLARANNPNHVALGWTYRCDRCHRPTDWNQAVLNP